LLKRIAADYRLPAKFYIILWTSMWAAAVGMFVMAFVEDLDVVRAQRFVALKMFVSMSLPNVVAVLD
jgi:hypothetical protein